MYNVKGESGVRAYCYPLNSLDLLQVVLVWEIRQIERTSIVQQTRWVNGRAFLKKKEKKVGRFPVYVTILLQSEHGHKSITSCIVILYAGEGAIKKRRTSTPVHNIQYKPKLQLYMREGRHIQNKHIPSNETKPYTKRKHAV